jgi:uncharacterized protein YjcR
MGLVTNKMLDQMRRLHEEGVIWNQIAEKLGVNSAVVSYWLKKEGLFPNPVSPVRRSFLPEYNRGMIDREIAEKHGVSPAIVCRWRHRNNLPPHRRASTKPPK